MIVLEFGIETATFHTDYLFEKDLWPIGYEENVNLINFDDFGIKIGEIDKLSGIGRFKRIE